MQLRWLGLWVLWILVPARAAADPEAGLDVLAYTNDDSVQVLTPQLWARHHLDEEGSGVGARVAVDIVSAASVDIVSSASFRFTELRTEVALDGAYRVGEYLPGLNYRFSGEPDYVSHTVGAGVEKRLGSPDSVGALSYAVTLDSVGMVDTPSDAFSESLTVHLAEATFTQVLGPKSLIRLAYSLAYQDGYLEKPYRSVPVFTRDGVAAAAADGVELGLTTFDDYRATRPPEEVPDTRHRHALATRAMTYVPSLDSSLRLDYRFYVDSWSMLGNTVEPAIYTKLHDEWRLEAWARVHHQTGADFWQRTYVVDDPLEIPAVRTIDEALSPQLSWGGGVRVEWEPAPVLVYVEGSATHTEFFDYLLLDALFAVTAQAGFQWTF